MSLAVVPQGESPDDARCAVLAQTQGQRLADFPVAVGGKLCLVTSEGRSALVTVTAVHPQAQNVSVDVRIWQKTD
ncbi:hypothetical protein ABT275_37240 [Streptomyces sp. NPDC001185]|uniref:hypothetical protein n=1 Tax=Streptomyces sp. NPDC001185 TaxID=3154380 RepID=UPI0033247E08